MEETTISINIELKTLNLNEADKVMKKMLKVLSYDELEGIKNARVSKTVAEVEISSNVFDNEKSSEEDEAE